MKTKAIYTFLITAIFVLTTNKLTAQLDTMNYLKQFEANKANYIGQPFSKLLNDMTQIQPKTIWSYSGGRVKTKTIGSTLNFCIKELTFQNNAITMLIYWQESIPKDQTLYYEQKNAFYFTNDERVFYGNRIIKDILVFR